MMFLMDNGNETNGIYTMEEVAWDCLSVSQRKAVKKMLDGTHSDFDGIRFRRYVGDKNVRVSISTKTGSFSYEISRRGRVSERPAFYINA
jgi:hypothetical protein